MPEKLFNFYNNCLVLKYKNLKNFQEKTKFYYEIRESFNENLNVFDVSQSAKFLFLNKTGYGGLFRTNSKGFYNVPFGNRKNLNFLDKKVLFEKSRLLENVHFSHKKFRKQNILSYEKGDFFYFDPPYVKTNKAAFTNYLSEGFTNKDFFELAEFCNNINKYSCYFTMSNSLTPAVIKFAAQYKTIEQKTNSLKGYKLNQLLITNSPNNF